MSISAEHLFHFGRGQVSPLGAALDNLPLLTTDVVLRVPLLNLIHELHNLLLILRRPGSHP